MKKIRAFTLIEVIIAVAIVGILASIAIPNYVEYLRRSHRNAVKSQLLLGAQWMELWRVANRAGQQGYTGALANFPASYQVSPPPGEGDALYTITLGAVTPVAYVLTAEPIPGGIMDGDDCGIFTINQLGQKTANGQNNGPVYDMCWRR